MANTVRIKKSAVAGKIPLAADLEYGELAINYADGKLYYKNATNIVGQLGGAGATPLLRVFQRGATNEAEATNVSIQSGLLAVVVREITDPVGVLGVAV
jgi:hypothetical protein